MTHRFTLYRLFCPGGKRFILGIVDQHEHQVCAQAHSKHINRRIHIPAKPLAKLLEYHNRRFTRANKEHIHLLPQTKLDKAIQSESDRAQTYKSPGRTLIVPDSIAATAGHTQKQADKHQQHVPRQSMGR